MLIAITCSMTSQKKMPDKWTLDDLKKFNPNELKLDTYTLRGREDIIEVLQNDILPSIFTANDHGKYEVLIASGHVRSGKTRIGQEVFQSLQESSNKQPIYLPVNLGNGKGFKDLFDPFITPSEALGARMVDGYFHTTSPLKAIDAGTVLYHLAGEDSETPIVVHIDEHSQYVHAFAKHFIEYHNWSNETEDEKTTIALEKGRKKFVSMLDELVGLTSSIDICVVVSGTSFGDVPYDHESKYNLTPLKLPLLNPDDCLDLVSDVIVAEMEQRKKKFKSLSLPQKSDILKSSLFKVALADTGGLPGFVVMLGRLAAGKTVAHAESYVQQLQTTVNRYLNKSVPERINIAILVSLARPPLKRTSKLLVKRIDEGRDSATAGKAGSKKKDISWTVQDASDSGTVNVIDVGDGGMDNQDVEIRLPSAVVATYTAHEESDLPLDISTLCCNVTKSDPWTWQRFEKAHMYYLAAVLHAIAKTKNEFWKDRSPTLSNALVSASPSDNMFLGKRLQVSEDFVPTKIIEDATQCIPRNNAKSKDLAVDLADVTHVHQAMDGTPIIDAYVNLSVGDNNDETTLFIQYKHSKECSDSTVKVSFMNSEAERLEEKISKSSWDQRSWLFLWVTNREVNKDTDDVHKNLIWVGKDALIEHAPLIGGRGLVSGNDFVRDEIDN